MKQTSKNISKLSLVFVASFAITFATSSISLADLLQVELDWGNFPKAVTLASEKTAGSISIAGSKIASGASKAGEAYLHWLIEVSDNLAYADEKYKTKTEIYSANGESEPEIALTAEEIRAKKSSFSVLIPSESSNIRSFIYYSQHDPRWKDVLIGGKDPIDTYGCGPTSLAMLVSNLSKANFTPDKAAEWAVQNGYYMKGSGSYHNIIVRGANAFNIDCAPYANYSEQAIRAQLQKGNVFAALMRPGVFSKASNHFILFLGLDEQGNVIIGEPNSHERTRKTWKLDFLLKELRYGANGGGPLWMAKLAK